MIPTRRLFPILACCSCFSSQLIANGESGPADPHQCEVEKRRETLSETNPLFLAASQEANPEKRNSRLGQWSNSLSIVDAAQVLESIESLADENLRWGARAALFGSWAEKDATSLAAWFARQRGGDSAHQQARDALGKAMASTGPRDRLAWMERSISESSRQELYIGFFREWAKADVRAAASSLLALAGSQPERRVQWEDLIGQIAAQWVNSDPASAVTWALSLSPQQGRSAALVQVCAKWTEIDPRGALERALQDDDPQVLRAVMGKRAESQPREMISLVEQSLPEKNRSEIFSDIMAIWARKDPTTAAGHAVTLSSPTLREKATAVAVSLWFESDPNAAKKWIAELPADSFRNVMLKNVGLPWEEE